ncbi:hypothetical protein EV421DRAFT_1455507 [Armillaria borealis]|uniref:Uncharacterized protein n=1 Tax=Armillaria borealis TaxID=47425 RepID=A0AA39J154_9AGAR|nr:hypothetical protein EV421DRAFT_1455507 [Armillaria borealis]
MNSEIAYLPDFGRPVGAYQPHDLSFMFPDPDEDVLVVLIITAFQKFRHISRLSLEAPMDGCCPFQRAIYTVHLDIVQEAGVDHFTNWGPITRTERKEEHIIPMAKLSLEKREQLGRIAAKTPVRIPDGTWNCQDWLITVLETAESQNILMHEDWAPAVQSAQKYT